MIQTKITLVKLAAYYEKILSPEQIEMYSQQLFENLTNQELSAACKKYINNPNNEFFPRPISKLIALVKNPIEDRDIAVSVSGLIIEAVSRFGHSNESDAMKFVGAEGEKIIKSVGGWAYLCENLGTKINLTTFHAQCRDAVVSNLRIGNFKNDSDKIKIEKMPKNLINFKIKEIEK